MKDVYLPDQASLLTEIRKWKNTESLCGSVYDDDALKSRSFQKMKLQSYRNLYQKYKGASLSVDEVALHRMLRYQYQKIEKALYPSRTVRLGRQLWTAIQTKVENLIKGRASVEDFNPSVIQPAIVSTGVKNSVQQSVMESTEKVAELQKTRPEGWWVNDLGQKGKNSRKDHKLGVH